jgi:hypothetical protein
MIDDAIRDGATLAAFRAGDGVCVCALAQDGEKIAVGYGPDLQEALADMWEKMNARRESGDHHRERR